MNIRCEEILKMLLTDYPMLESCRDSILSAYEILEASVSQGGKILICGNGGSAADSEHMTGELMKGFLLRRPIDEKDREKIRKAFPREADDLSGHLQGAIPAISLVSQVSLLTAFANDVAADMAFAQQVYGYGRAGDVLVVFSTSGNSGNIVNALMVARAFGMKTVGLTGDGGGRMRALCDAPICVPAVETYRIQELTLPIYHALCAMLEARFFMV